MSQDAYACPEYQALSRRTFLTSAAATAAAVGLPAWMPQVAFADSGPERDALIFINLRGGADALSIVCPHGDSNYYAARPNVAVARPGSGPNAAIDLDGYFGLHPALLPLVEAYQNNHLAIVHAAGRENWSRSHFDAQLWMNLESLDPNKGGWLARYLATMAPLNPEAPFRAISYHDFQNPILARAPQTVFSSRIQNVLLTDDRDYNEFVHRMYARVRNETRGAVRDSMRAAEVMQGLAFPRYAPAGNAVYSESNFGHAMKATAALLRAQVGLEVAHVDVHGWDTHASQGTLDGTLANLLNQLATNLAAFYTDMASAGNLRWTVVVVSEFGRQLRENGSRGTDHGTAGIMLLLGGGVNGGQIHGSWPGLAIDQLFQRVDLKPTTDTRAVLAELLQKRLKNTRADLVLPEFTGTPTQGIFRAA